jgi:hypothetical protein
MSRTRRIHTYSNGILRWKLDEKASGVTSFANTGRYAGSAMLINGNGTTGAQAVMPGDVGPLGRGVRFFGPKGDQHAGLATATPSVVPAAGEQLTMSIWAFLHSNNVGGAATVSLFRKSYTAVQGTQTTPNLTIGLAIENTGKLRCFVTTGTNGSGTTTGFNGSIILPVHQPLFLAMTYDGKNARSYVNGLQDGVVTKSGNIDWNTLGGPWAIGNGWYTQATTSANTEIDGILQEAVVELGVIPTDMLRNRYLRGLGMLQEDV